MKCPAATFVLSEAIDEPGYIHQHDMLVDALRSHGATVLQVPLVPGAPDSVFMKDSAVLIRTGRGEHRALMAWPRHEGRQIEQAHREKSLREIGFAIGGMAEVDFEGGDVEQLADGETVLLGYGFRSKKEVAAQLGEFLNLRIVPLELADRELFHLDLAVGTLSDGSVFACKEALTIDAWKTLSSLNCIRDLITVSLKDADRFNLNWIEVNGKVLMTSPSSALREKIEKAGFEVHALQLDEFHARRGSAACLAAKVMVQPASNGG